jgi:hypothetical protein
LKDVLVSSRNAMVLRAAAARGKCAGYVLCKASRRMAGSGMLCEFLSSMEMEFIGV